jgi:glutamine amidotransferase
MDKISVGIIDYGIGNIKSIINAIEEIGATPILTSKEKEILSLDTLILPGVGAFKMGMENLRIKKLIDPIYKFVEMKKPFLGICLGMQMLLDESEEFELTKGLGLIQGRVNKIYINDNPKVKLPHVGWNTIEINNNKTKDNIFVDIKTKSDVYFVHSYIANPIHKENILTITEYEGLTFCSSIVNKNVFGFQFHPEKSGATGLKILNNFINLSK